MDKMLNIKGNLVSLDTPVVMGILNVTPDSFYAASRQRGEADILRAIYAEAERGRRAGTLTDAELDNFYAAVSPMLDSAKRKKLEQVVKKLKKT